MEWRRWRRWWKNIWTLISWNTIDYCLAASCHFCSFNCINEMAQVFILCSRFLSITCYWVNFRSFNPHDNWSRSWWRWSFSSNAQLHRFGCCNLVRCLNCHRYFSKNYSIFYQNQSEHLYLDKTDSSHLELPSDDSCQVQLLKYQIFGWLDWWRFLCIACNWHRIAYFLLNNKIWILENRLRNYW